MNPGELGAKFDQAVNNPARRGDVVGDLFRSLGEAAEQIVAQKRARRDARREARRNDPGVRAIRSAAARKGWDTRRARQAAAAAEAEDELAWERDVPDVTCDALVTIMDARETFCRLEPDHEDDHDNFNGYTWPRED